MLRKLCGLLQRYQRLLLDKERCKAGAESMMFHGSMMFHDVPGFKDYVLMLIATRGNASTQYGDMDTNFPHSDFGLYTKLLSLAAFKSSQKMGSG